MGISWLPNMLRCRNRCLAGIIALGFIRIKGFIYYIVKSDPESEGLTALVITWPGKSFVPPSIPL